MPSDELRHARPRWLGKLSLGTWLALLAWAGVPVAYWMLGEQSLIDTSTLLLAPSMLQLLPLPITAVALLLAAGVWLLARSDHRAGAGPRGRWGLAGLRMLGLIPLAGAIYLHITIWSLMVGKATVGYVVIGAFEDRVPLVIVASAALPLFGFLRLRGLAKRVLDPSLAEHCAIVGVGMTASILLPAAVAGADWYTRGLLLDTLRVDPAWSTAFFVAVMLGAVAILLFYLWAGFLLFRFALAFRRARSAARRAWAEADAAATI